MREKKVLPPAYLYVAILGMVGLHFVVPGATVIWGWYRLIGAALLVLGVVVNIWANGSYERTGTTVKPFEEPSHLIADGAYGYSRHPMYLGMIAGVVGLAVLLGSATPWVLIPPFGYVMKRFADVEEDAMEAAFGDGYREYARRVRRWV